MRSILVSLALFLSASATAQMERIDTDRPDQTESAFTVPKKYFQGEFGFGKENSEWNNYVIVHPTFLLKYGLGKKIELRLEGNFLSAYEQLIPEPKTTTSFQPMEVGTKLALFEQKGLLPKTSLIVHLGSSFKDQWNFYPSFRFTFQNSITEKFALGYNLGWQKDEEASALLYTFAPSINIGKRWYSYVEAFGFRINNEISGISGWQHALDLGLAYYTSDNTKIDLSGGVGLGGNPLENYIALGFSFRLPLGKGAKSN